MAEASGEPLPDLFEMVDGEMVHNGKIPDMKAWQIIKEGIDGIIGDETSDFGKVSSKGVAYLKLKHQMLDILDDDAVNPAYKNARKVYSGYASMENAMKKGSRILRDDDYLTKKAFDKMSDSDKDAYLMGAMNAIRDKVELVSENADVTLRQMFTAPAMKRRMAKAFPDEDSHKEFMRIVKSEGRKAETNKAIYNSKTNSRGQHQARMGMDMAGDVMGATHGNPFSFLRLGGNAIDNMKKLPPQSLEDLSRALISPIDEQMGRQIFGTSKMPRYLNSLTSKEAEELFRLTGQGLLGYTSGKMSTN